MKRGRHEASIVNQRQRHMEQLHAALEAQAGERLIGVYRGRLKDGSPWTVEVTDVTSTLDVDWSDVTWN